MSEPCAAVSGTTALVALCERELEAARQAIKGQDNEALHDFRVALRRLRVLVKAFSQPGSARKRVLHRIVGLQKKSNRLRDAEVMLAWLAEEWPRLDKEERVGAAVWRGSIRRVQHHALLRPKRSRAGLQQVEQGIASLAMREGTLGELAAIRLEKQMQRLRQLMNRPRDSTQLHRLRLQVKSVRYLLLPFCETAAPCQAAEALLHQLQDQLGEWHDTVVRQQSITRVLRKEMVALSSRRYPATPDTGMLKALAPALPGLLVLARRNVATQHQLEALIADDYLSNRGLKLMQVLHRAVNELRAQAALFSYHERSVTHDH